jgi:hypothetical protein
MAASSKETIQDFILRALRKREGDSGKTANASMTNVSDRFRIHQSLT